jgi:thermitase
VVLQAQVGHVPGRIVVKMRGLRVPVTGALAPAQFASLGIAHQELLSRHSVRSLKKIFPGSVSGLRDWCSLEVSSSSDIAALAREMGREPLVEHAEPDYYAKPLLTPDDPLLPQQWHHNNTGQSVAGVIGTAGADIRSLAAWDLWTGSTSVVIAVLDTGIQLSHPDLAGNLMSGGWDFADNDSVPEDDNGHGTHVAGIIAAQGNNGTGVSGILWRARILPVRVCNSGGCPYTAIADGLRFAADNSARVINMSLGGSADSSLMKDAVDYAAGRGALIVAAAGNDGVETPGYPAYYDNVIAVAATDNQDALASFSQRGSWIDISAPGKNILSTYLSGTTVLLSGTSMASPMVAGSAGLLLSRLPGLTAQEVRSRLLAYAKNIDDQNPGLTGKLGAGRLNLQDLLALIPDILSFSLTPDESSLRNGSLITSYQAQISTGISGGRAVLLDQLDRELGSGNTSQFIVTGSSLVSGSIQIGELSSRYPLVSSIHLRLELSNGPYTSSQTVKTWRFQETAQVPAGGRAAVWNGVFDPTEGGKATVRLTLEQAGHVTVRVMRGDGTLIQTLADEEAPAGVRTWDWSGNNNLGSTVASGLYLIHIRGPGVNALKKVVLVK